MENISIIKDEEKDRRISEIFSKKNIEVIDTCMPLKKWVYKNIDDLYDFEITKSNYEEYFREDAVCSKNIRSLAHLAQTLYYGLDCYNATDIDILRARNTANKMRIAFYRIIKEQKARYNNEKLEEEYYPNCEMDEIALIRYRVEEETEKDISLLTKKKSSKGNKKACK